MFLALWGQGLYPPLSLWVGAIAVALVFAGVGMVGSSTRADSSLRWKLRRLSLAWRWLWRCTIFFVAAISTVQQVTVALAASYISLYWAEGLSISALSFPHCGSTVFTKQERDRLVTCVSTGQSGEDVHLLLVFAAFVSLLERRYQYPTLYSIQHFITLYTI